ncbi:hypothetical protein [Salipiger bermudensis]|nr:hypothetical protein [Salipiger bermudensis]MBN9674638.1 hypothetical protein [Salipiger bermudensis]
MADQTKSGGASAAPQKSKRKPRLSADEAKKLGLDPVPYGGKPRGN